MNNYSKMSADELRWRGRDDARTLAEAEAIKADKARMANAQKEAQNILNEESARLKGISKVAGGKLPVNTPNPRKERDVRRHNAMPFGFPTTPTM